MNAPLRISNPDGDQELEKAFIEEATAKNMIQRKGHRSVHLSLILKQWPCLWDQSFVLLAAKQLTLLFDFRSVGGIRVSMYNAVKLDDVKTLVDFMKDFRQRHQKQWWLELFGFSSTSIVFLIQKNTCLGIVPSKKYGLDKIIGVLHQVLYEL